MVKCLIVQLPRFHYKWTKIMKIIHVLILVSVLAITSGCENLKGGNNLYSKQIKDLQNQLIRQKQKTTIAFTRISSNPIGLSAMEDFFLTSEKLFTEIVDVGYSNCITDCAEIQNIDNKKACFAKCTERFEVFPNL